VSGQIRDIPSPVPANFVAEIDRRHWTNEQAARELGVSERQITRWRGGQVPRHKFVVKMAEVFARDVEWMYTNHETVAA
jgi:transcriptional regulator with XRE-family HTH domain